MALLHAQYSMALSAKLQSWLRRQDRRLPAAWHEAALVLLRLDLDPARPLLRALYAPSARDELQFQFAPVPKDERSVFGSLRSANPSAFQSAPVRKDERCEHRSADRYTAGSRFQSTPHLISGANILGKHGQAPQMRFNPRPTSSAGRTSCHMRRRSPRPCFNPRPTSSAGRTLVHPPRRRPTGFQSTPHLISGANFVVQHGGKMLTWVSIHAPPHQRGELPLT